MWVEMGIEWGWVEIGIEGVWVEMGIEWVWVEMGIGFGEETYFFLNNYVFQKNNKTIVFLNERKKITIFKSFKGS